MAGQNERRCVGENLRRRTLKLRKTSEDTVGCRCNLRQSDNFSEGEGGREEGRKGAKNEQGGTSQ